MGAGPEVGMSFARADGRGPTETEVHARMKVLIGVDPHKASVAVAVVDEAVGGLVEHANFPHNRTGLRALERWAKRFPERRWAVENASGLGRHLAGRLAAAGESVVDVPPKLSARVRVLSTGNARKNDGLDALATALAASRNERLAAVDPEAASEVLRDIRTLDKKIADLNGRIETEVEASGTTLTQIFGIGPILAARIIGTVGDVSRFPTKAHFASYSGAAPLETSSGDLVRHRLSLAGNRHLNYALHMIAVCQARSDARGGVYYRKKIAEGKSRKEALRCLKRRVSDAVFRNLVADSQAPSRSAA